MKRSNSGSYALRVTPKGISLDGGRARSKSRFARPYIWRLRNFSRLICPSTARCSKATRRPPCGPRGSRVAAEQCVWRWITSTRGDLRVEVIHRHVWLWDKHGQSAHRWHLIVRREVNSPATVKYSVSNADEQTSVNKLAQMQAQRFWIERAFQDAKSHVGMADYQARMWQSWHRHMALVMMAMQFMLETRIKNAELLPLLSCYDIQSLIATTMPGRRSDSDEVIRQLHERHRKRQASIDSAHETRNSMT